MEHYDILIARQRKWMFYFLAILVVGAGFTPYIRIFLGLLLGSIVSFYNLYLLQRKIDDFAKAVEKKQPARGLGTISRFAAAAAAIIIAIRFAAYFNMIAVIIGLMTSYLIIMIDFIFFNKRD
jgi:ATP synthase protein I